MYRVRRSPFVFPITVAAAFVVPAVAIHWGGGAAPQIDPVAWAQASSCGNAILEPGEACDPPGSLTCPPASPGGAFAACNADCTCGEPVAALDHFQCYAIKRRGAVQRSVTVEDQFGTTTQTLRAPNRLCVPSDKNGEGITDPTDHLVGYDARSQGARFAPRRNQLVVDQFGSLRLDVLRPSSLLVPSAKDGVGQTPPLDHFQCYVVKRAKGAPQFAERTVSIANQTETTSVTLVRPVRLCAPASKNGEDPTAPGHPDHLLCYRTARSRFGDARHTVANQFGEATIRVISRNELCVPSLKNPAPTTTSTTSTSSTTSSSSTTSTSSTSSTTSTSTSSTSTSSTQPTTTSTTTSSTTTTLYGSPGRAFLEPNASLLD